MRRRKPAKYYGVLLNPIRVSDLNRWEKQAGDPLFLSTRAKRMQRDREIETGRQERVSALFKHYDLELGQWQELALALANQHVPGFTVIPNDSRVEVTDELKSRFYRYVNRRRANWGGAGASIRAVCKKLPNDPEFKQLFPELVGEAGSLQNLHSKAKNLRRQYVEWTVRRWALQRLDDYDETQSGYIMPAPPPWFPAAPSAIFKKCSSPEVGGDESVIIEK